MDMGVAIGDRRCWSHVYASLHKAGSHPLDDVVANVEGRPDDQALQPERRLSGTWYASLSRHGVVKLGGHTISL